MTTVEQRKGSEFREWSYRQPVVLIESQSAPILWGDEVEQRYMRGCNLARKGDLVVTDFPLNELYVYGYLGGILELDLPDYLVVDSLNKGCLSENIMDSANSDKAVEIKKRLGDGAKIQFFNVTESEAKLAEVLGAEVTCGDVRTTLEVGSKTGFRRLAEFLNLPMPRGFVCNSFESTVEAVSKILDAGNDVLIKAQNGTGGNELKSNCSIKAGVKKELLHQEVRRCVEYLGSYIGDEWVVEEKVKGADGSIHVYINDEKSAEKAFILGSISDNDSYVGGYSPFTPNAEQQKMLELVDNKLVPALQQMGVFGFHCLDFIGGYFLEDNVRPGALDFIDGLVNRVVEKHFKGENFAYWHCHVPVPRKTSFEEIYSLIGDYMDPRLSNGCLALVTNQEVLPYGRALDLTVLCYKGENKLETCQNMFNYLAEAVKRGLN